jgi:hypothetical protein
MAVTSPAPALARLTFEQVFQLAYKAECEGRSAEAEKRYRTLMQGPRFPAREALRARAS